MGTGAAKAGKVARVLPKSFGVDVMQPDFMRALKDLLWKYHREILCFAFGFVIGGILI
jgi:hypothetical protein